jgi:ubiquinone/menaquinone biosynthesis C-methylase UbiE
MPKQKLQKQNVLQFRDGKIIRIKEFDQVFHKWKASFKEPLLEIGSGEGQQYKMLKQKLNNVIPSDIEDKRWDYNLGKLMIVNAEQLPFETDSIQTVFSSNVLEHIYEIDESLSEMKRVLHPSGVMIHIMPTRAWKVVQFFGYHLSKTRDMLATGRLFNPFVKSLVHGVSRNSISEYDYFSSKQWQKKFDSAGFKIEETTDLLFYSPYRFFPNAIKVRKFLASTGLSSCKAYLISHKQ